MSQPASDPDGIERDLNQTRSRLDNHLSQLQDRLSPGQVLDDLMGYFRGSEGANFGRNLLDNVRGNPMPAAITAIGLAWLMASKQSSSQPSSSTAREDGVGRLRSQIYGGDDHAATMLRLQEAETAAPRGSEEADDTYSARLDDARGQAIGLARHAQETTQSFGERISAALAAMQGAVANTAQGVSDQVGSAANAASSRTSGMGATAQDAAHGAIQSVGGALSRGSQTGGNVMTAIAESPVLLGALGLAAGAILGALVPQTEQEEAALGSLAGQARGTVTNVANQAMESGKQIAQTVLEKGHDSVQATGLSNKSPGELVDAALSGDLAGNTKTVVQDALKAGDEAVRKEVEPLSNAAAEQSLPPTP
jgi:hypothetical protein